jgi:hypothetical protein
MFVIICVKLENLMKMVLMDMTRLLSPFQQGLYIFHVLCPKVSVQVKLPLRLKNHDS